MKEKAENDRMMKLYRENVLGEKPVEGGKVVPLERDRSRPLRPLRR